MMFSDEPGLPTGDPGLPSGDPGLSSGGDPGLPSEGGGLLGLEVSSFPEGLVADPSFFGSFAACPSSLATSFLSSMGAGLEGADSLSGLSSRFESDRASGFESGFDSGFESDLESGF
eukprot:CAMPEP_0170512728 /NCGR_PEP_ID=MMETSP0208-20121228/67008_1 /TAXON_ID=197538 /ORGANISM="Strombidium inclinatum, Strain S3" /LENGTH=116 /DNA_ID=CAMNT_0010796389 /DNA_START=397 /DNA_END=747 /DNA_ORIENTATION=+